MDLLARLLRDSPHLLLAQMRLRLRRLELRLLVPRRLRRMVRLQVRLLQRFRR